MIYFYEKLCSGNFHFTRAKQKLIMKRKIIPFLVLLTLIVTSGLQAKVQKQNMQLLSDTIDVVHYDLKIDLTSLSTQQIRGQATLRLTTPLTNISQIPLNLLQLAIDSVISSSGNHLTYTHNGDMLRIATTTPFSSGDTISLKVFYSGTPFHEAWGGFHFYNPYAFNLGVGFQSIPHNLGKTWFPCVDDFTDRAFYDYHIRVGNENMAACGGLLQSVTDLGDGSSEYWWKSDRSIPTYLASVAAGPYALVTGNFQGMEAEIPITWYVRPTDTAKIAGSFVNLNAIASIYENSFGYYPFQRIGITGTVLGAMEHAENIFYPSGSINGNLSNEWLYAHELSHMWFGNMVTCASAEDMWLNEGWARWCETLYREQLYGIEAARDNMRSLKREVLRYAHISEGGYLPLYPMPQEITYGTHVYDKGSTVTHGLRGYLGDDLFFEGVKAYLETFAWQSASSTQMRDFLSQQTGVDLTGFFDFHVFGPGYNQVAVDSFKVTPSGNSFDVEVFVQQKLKGAEVPANDCRTELALMNSLRQVETRVINFSGFNGSATFNLPFEPEMVMVDMHEKFNGAVTSKVKNIKTAGLYNFDDTYFKMEVENVADSAFVFVAHNWVAPDELKTPQNGLSLSDYRYWIINGLFPQGFEATGRFTYSRVARLDHTLILSSADSLVILYRPDASHDWQPISFTRSGNWMAGTMFVPHLKTGEYTLAIWDEAMVGAENNKPTEKKLMRIMPNPCSDYANVHFSGHADGMLYLLDPTGKIHGEYNIDPGKPDTRLNLANKNPGNYILQFAGRDGRKELVKFVVLR
jgi:aminopeptidase N